MSSVADAYDRAADGWRRGPEAVYARLADALVENAPGPVSGARVLDIGAGTAVAARAALRAGAASVVAADLATGMLAHRDPGVRAVCADAQRLPFADVSFDLALAAFCLGHLPDPVRALREARRVAGRVAASAFAPGWTHPAKAVVDEVMAGHGFELPGWYAQVKGVTEPAVNDAVALAALAQAAGFAAVEVRELQVDSGLTSAAEVVAWRFGMAHLAPFVAGLALEEVARARAEAEEAVAGSLPVVIPVLVLSAS
jgi:SAM-dependent methyltransferase